LAQAHACGGSNCKGRGITQGLQRSAARVESPLVCTNGAQRSAEDWGNPLRARGAELLSVLRTCVTKQTKDMRYSEAEH
jgi:hypothetical protein